MHSLTDSWGSSQLEPTIDPVIEQFEATSILNAFYTTTSYSSTTEQHHLCQQEISSYINITQYNFPAGINRPKFGWNEYFKITLYACVMLASLFGNSAVVLAVCLKRTLRVTVNLYLANLAVADILICVCCMWVHLVNHLTAPVYVLGPLVCKFNGFAQMTCLTSSVLTLSAISCDRYMAIMYPLRSRVTKKRTDAVIGAIWLFSLLISVPFLIYRRLRILQWSDFKEINCMEAWPSTSVYSPEIGSCVQKHVLKRIYYTLVTSTLFFVPVLVMLTAYSAIIWKLWVNRVPGEAHYANIRQQKKSKRKVIQMVVVVLLVFVICWLPLQLAVLYSIYVHSAAVLPEWFPKLSYYSTFIAYSNSAFNPIIYGGFNKNFRDALCNNAFCTFWWWKDRQLKRPRYSTKSTMSTVVTTMNQDTPRNGSHDIELVDNCNMNTTTECTGPFASKHKDQQLMLFPATPNANPKSMLLSTIDTTNKSKVKSEVMELEALVNLKKDSFI